MKERWHYFDNLKLFLITCVVIGHVAGSYDPDTFTGMGRLYYFIYSFHMPLFVFVSGFFVKSAIQAKRFKIERVIIYLMLYVFQKVVFFAITKTWGTQEISFQIFSELGSPWYLLAMAIFLGVTFLIKEVKPVYVMAISIVLALLVGYDHTVNDFLVLSRLFTFYPFFYFGYWLSKERLEKILKIKSLKFFSLCCLAIFALIVTFRIWWVAPFRGVLSGRNSYWNIAGVNKGIFIRMGWYIIVPILCLAVMYLIPKGKTIFSDMGTRTLQVFIIHAIIIQILWESGWFMRITRYLPNTWKYLVLGGGLILTLVLALPVFEWPFKKIMSLKFAFLMQKEESSDKK